MSARIVFVAVLALVSYASIPTPACATGTIAIHHSNGKTSTYNDVEIKVLSGSLFLTTDDGNGTIVVTRAACSYQGKLIVCLPTLAALVQDGESSPLALKTGTIYLNYTGEAQSLWKSSQKVPANSAMVALTLQNGTFITLHGRLDQVIRQ
ncbi:MAG TPA: hypothetical protein VGI19_03575 [Candidatus Cybelea sp.]